MQRIYRAMELKNGVKNYYLELEYPYALQLVGNPFDKIEESNILINLENTKILSPVLPRKIIAVGLNYKDHAEELKFPIPEEPVLFMKPSTTVIGHKEYIILPPQSKRVDYEAELGIIIGKKCYNVSEREAKNYIFGYTCLNDITARDLQKKDGQWIRAKSFNTFCPMGPCIATNIDVDNLEIKLKLNGEVKQHSNTRNLIFKCEELVSFVSNIMTLYPGDVIATGTPSGIGPLKEGDVVEVEIEKIGTLCNYVST